MEPNFIPPRGSFASVVAVVELMGGDLCRRYTPQVNCDFEVVLYKTNLNFVNAFQTMKSDGRPLIVFSQGLIEHARKEDELPFVLGHEMAHHLEGICTSNIIPLAAAPRGLVGEYCLSVPRIVWSAMQSILTRAWVDVNFPKHLSWKRIGWALGLLRSRGMMPYVGLPFFCACWIRVTSS